MEKPLRKGWTTGASAAAAAKAAWSALLSGCFPERAEIVLPQGQTPSFALSRAGLGEGWAEAGVIKDAGDDPDVTHGAEIVVRVQRAAPGAGLSFHAGPGVGRVTLPGLPLAVGEPAINPGPRRQIAANMENLGVALDARVTISIPGGERLALQTMNARLGIVEGLSILGTTGVVIPYSCAAWIHAIQSGVDVARALGLGHLAGCTGKTSEEAVQRLHGLNPQSMIDMGGFAGGLLKYLRRHPVPRLTIGGGFAKLSKLAAGHLDLHSQAATIDKDRLALLLAEAGAPAKTVLAAKEAGSAALIQKIGEPWRLAELVAARSREAVMACLSGHCAVDVVVVDRQGTIIGHAG